MRLRFVVPAAALALAASVLAPRDARACGGCYHRASETETTVVTGHRMVLSVSTTQTVLWDQIEYQGNPSDFAWVLPVKPGARVELATDAWFETLDAATSVNVVSPPLDCPPPPGVRNGGGCGAQDEMSAGAESGGVYGKSDVNVVHEGTVGPYETVTLSTDTPGALDTWLADHGYAVDEGIQPIIDAYVAEGFDFIALRLQPGQGVRAMKPVRVVSPGASPTLPLRMVAAGTGASVAITLFVIGEGRWTSDNFPGATVPTGALTWDFLTSESNYGTLRELALDAGEGRTWLTTFAKKGALLSPVQGGGPYAAVSYGMRDDYQTIETIAEAYLVQAGKNGEAGTGCATDYLAHAGSSAVVVDPCPPDNPDPAACAAVGAAQIDARVFACGPADDLATALTGLHPRDVWVTRLEAELPRVALASDLDLTPAPEQAEVQNWLRPAQLLHAQEICRASVDQAVAAGALGGSRGGRPPRNVSMGLVIAALAALGVAARRIRRAPAAVLRCGRPA